MSTTFDVFPHNAKLPSFGVLVEQAMPRIRHYLDRHGCRRCPPLRFDLRDNSHKSQGYTQHSPMKWSEQHYAWFCFDGVDGGTDAYWVRIDDLMLECWTYEKKERQRSTEMAVYIDECLA